MARAWTDEEKQKLRHMRDADKMSWKDISKHFKGANDSQCASIYHYGNRKHLPRPPRAIQKKRPVVKVKPNPAAALPTVRGKQLNPSSGPRMTTDVIAERDRRADLRAQRTDVTANFFGDPLPGESALDRARSRS